MPRTKYQNYVWRIGWITGTARVKLGAEVMKHGPTTGLTVGVVDDVHYTARIKSTGVELTEQFVIRTTKTDQDNFRSVLGVFYNPAFSAPGDSGSVIVNKDREAVGLLHGKMGFDGVANHLDNVFAALNLILATTGSAQEAR